MTKSSGLPRLAGMDPEPQRMKVDQDGASPLERMFALCSTDQAREYVAEKRSFRLHGHSTTVRLERAFWNVLEELAREESITVGALIERIYEHCLTANDKNLASCLRVVCLKYINLGA